MNYERFFESAPTVQLPPSALGQTVGWSSQDKRPVSLRDFIAARAPRAVGALLDTDSRGDPEHVKRITELTDEELQETVCALLGEAPENIRVAILGHGDFSIEDLIGHVRTRSDLGLRLISAARRHIDLLERLVEAGKLRVAESGQPSVRVPAFDF